MLPLYVWFGCGVFAAGIASFEFGRWVERVTGDRYRRNYRADLQKAAKGDGVHTLTEHGWGRR